MSISSARRLAAGVLLAGLLLGLPSTVAAEVTGACAATGQGSASGSVDITTEEVWHLKSTESAGGSATAAAPMLNATVSAFALGLQVPIASGTSKSGGDTAGSVDAVDLQVFGKLGKIFLVAGNATGAGGAECRGQILIILDDVDALFTLLGGGAIVLAILAVAGVLATSRMRGCAGKVLGAGFGLVAGASTGIALAQFQIIAPDSPIGWAIALVGMILGFFLASRFAKPTAPAAATGGRTPAVGGSNPPPDRPGGSPTPPPVSDDTQGFIDGVAAPAVDAPVSDPDSRNDTLPPGGVGGGGPM